MDEKQARLEAMELEKERKIRHYMELQDQADAMNEQIYHVCCDVEALNVQISALKEEIKKAALKDVKPPIGVHKPQNGNGSGNGNGAPH
jgi:predicted  nucleic acid-binding Zn-ribbon protein